MALRRVHRARGEARAVSRGRWRAVSGARCRQRGPVYLSTGYFLWPILPGLALPEEAEACANCAGL